MLSNVLKKNVSGEPWIVILGNTRQTLWRKQHLGLDLKHCGGELSGPPPIRMAGIE